jgi:GntR family transcriptional regulator
MTRDADFCLQLDPTGPTTLHQQIVEQVRDLIIGAHLPAGVSIPSVREVAARYAIDRMTVSKAYAQLVEDGWLLRKPGQAMEVRLPSLHVFTSRYRLSEIDHLVKTLTERAARLNIEPAQLLERVQDALRH